MAKLLRDIVEKITADKRLEGKKSSKVAPPDIDDKNFYNWEGGKDGVAFIKKHKTETHDYPQDTASFKGKKGDMKKAAYKAAPQDTYEEVEQIDEISKRTAVKALGMRVAQAPDGWLSDPVADKKATASHKRVEKKFGDAAIKAAYNIATRKIHHDYVTEKLTKGMSAGEVISDFVHSDDPKFAGKSKKERMRMALGAYYSMNPSKSRKKMEEAATCNMSEAGKMCEVHGEAECPGYKAERKGGRKLLLGGKKKMEEGVMDTIKDRIKDPNPPEKYTPKFETDPKKKNPNTGSSPSPEDREALEKKSKDATNEATDPNLAVTMIESGKKSKKKMKNEQAAPYDGGIVPNPTGASYSSIGRDGAV